MAGRRQTVLGLTIGLILVVAISGLAMYHRSKIDPDAVKKEFEAKIAALDQIPGAEIARKDQAAEELLAVELYKEHAKALWLKLERTHRSLHDAAQLDRAAQKDVASFLSRSKASGGDVRTLEAEARSLILSYGGTRFGRALRDEQARLQSLLESMRGFGAPDYLNLVRDLRKAEQDGHFAAAMALIDAAVKQCADPREYEQKFTELREEVKRKAEAGASKVLVQILGRPRPDAIERIETALPDYAGLPARVSLETRLRELRKP